MKKENLLTYNQTRKEKAIEIGYMIVAAVGLLLAYTLFAALLMLILVTIFGSFQ
jgi:hypothetical protein